MPRQPPMPVTWSAPARVTKFLVPDVVSGTGVLSEVGRAAKRQEAVRVFVVSDPAVVAAGWTGAALEHLSAAELGTDLWIGITPDPKDHEVECR